MSEVRAAYEVLGQAAVMTLAQEVASWNHHPVFKYEVNVTRKQWRLTIKWDGRTKAGKIYNWVSEGTGERGIDPAGEAYIIKPKKKKALRFTVPLVTKTVSPEGIAPSAGWEQGEVVTKGVRAPGIFPRFLGKILYEHLKSQRSGSFRNVTEAGIKRAFRRLGIWVG
jgi:hypothetical protein